ncbi:MAG: glycerate kinase [Leptolyngbyaceae bacterium]|nr:glycerate kinase [Leptolyngbyaceae bacterium]
MIDEHHVYATVAEIFEAYHAEKMSADEAIAQLTECIQRTPQQAAVYGLNHHNHEQCRLWVMHQFEVYQTYWSPFQQLCQDTLCISPSPSALLWMLWIPLAIRLIELHHAAQRPVIQGILGGQGTGKTTLATVVSHLLEELGYRVCGLSIDDLYKTHEERQELRSVDPRLRWRGPPGTHDVSLGLQVLKALKQPKSTTPIEIPRFDKSLHGGSGDRIAPESIEGADIVLFEGWFVGVRPISPSAFENAPSPIHTDADRQFARDMNEKLADYVPLWEELDQLMVIYPTDYRLSQQWRQQAEDKMKAQGKTGMSNEEIQEFVNYFWRSLHPDLFITPLLHRPDLVDWVVQVNRDRSIHSMYVPSTDTSPEG